MMRCETAAKMQHLAQPQEEGRILAGEGHVRNLVIKGGCLSSSSRARVRDDNNYLRQGEL
jgi:hypothetical protein